MYGDLGFLGMSFQNSWGTANVTSLDFFPIVSENITHEIDQIITQTLQARFEEGPTYAGIENIKGDVVMELHPIHAGKLLKAWCGQESVTLVGSVYNHSFIPRQSDWDEYAALPPVTLEIFRDNGSSSYLFYDLQVDGLTIEISNGQVWRTTMSVLGGKFKKQAKSTPTYAAGSGYPWDVTSMQLGGAANDDHTKLTLKCSNKLKQVYTLDGTRTANRIKRGDKRTVDINGTAIYYDDTEADKFRAQTTQALKLNAKGQSLTTSQNADFGIMVPQMRYTSYPANISGPGMIEVGFGGAAKYDTTSNYLIEFTLQNTKAAY
jgi:hypothetical protein